ncbi:MAG: transposase family protein, partial [Candidatus Thiodiazotropha endolucinida]|nr:transposase family protein [Candidatus Thiodiazotropha taylori]MCW4263473.1 transposase family protein [Candidatus Thiodiazotropha endolucinida]
LVIGDYFTKLTELYPLPNITARTVADYLFRGWIKRYGCPREIHSDQGRQFESALFKEVCALLQIKKTKSTTS